MKLEELELEIEKLDAVDGDVVVFKFNYEVEPSIIAQLSAKLYDALPKGVRCLVAGPSVDVSVIKASDVPE